MALLNDLRSATVAITPSVPHPIAGRDISLVLDISTVTSPACDWKLSGKTLALKITSGADLIWTTVQCAKVIPTRELVLRNTGLGGRGAPALYQQRHTIGELFVPETEGGGSAHSLNC